MGHRLKRNQVNQKSHYLLELILFIIVVLANLNLAQAQQYFEGATGRPVEAEAVLDAVHPGQVLIISELHDNLAHHQNQAEVLKGLIRREKPFSLGMEFINYTDQSILDDYVYDKITEDQFLDAVKWAGFDFSFYRFLVRIPIYFGGKSLGLNIPRHITSKIAKSGLEALTQEEVSLLPPHFELGRESYFERFRKSIEGHLPDNKILNYFTAQSLWDDTMAWRASEFLLRHPEQVFVIIVGDFHVAYQDGLISRLNARGVTDILSISQVDSYGMTTDEKNQLIRPSTNYGIRADYVYDSNSQRYSAPNMLNLFVRRQQSINN